MKDSNLHNMEDMDTIRFSYNWNNKLHCNAFTTLRLYNPKKHICGNRFHIALKDQYLGTAVITQVKPLYLRQINEFIAFLDTGYPADQCQNIILRMYPKVNFADQKLALILLVKTKDNEK